MTAAASPVSDESAIVRLARRQQPQPSPSSRLVCENVADGVSLTDVSPCGVADLAAFLRHTNWEGAPSWSDVRATLSQVHFVLERERALLAGAESLQTGVPLTSSLAALEVAAQSITDALTQLPTKATIICHEKMLMAPPVVCLLTPSYFSLAYALVATASAYMDAAARHTTPPPLLWLPSPAAFLSAQWLMHRLGEQDESARRRQCLHVMLLGDRSSHLREALPPQAPPTSSSSAPRMVAVDVVLSGMTPAAARDTHKALLTSALPLSSWDVDSPSMVWVPPSPVTDINALVQWVLQHSFQRPFNSSRCCSSGTLRAPVLWVPQSLVPPLLRSVLLSVQRCLGHSLDHTVVLGPLSGATHVQAAQETVTAALHKRQGKPRWEHVGGGFRLPLTGAATMGNAYVPAVLYTDWRGGPNSVADICASVQDLLEPLENAYSGAAGAVVCVCGYPDDEADGAAAVQRSVQAFCCEGGHWRFHIYS